MTVLVLVIWTLAVMRLTRLVNADTILDRPRLWLARRAVAARDEADEARNLGQTVRHRRLARTADRWEAVLAFFQCPWCVGMWVALATAWAPMLWLSWFADPWHLDLIRYLMLVLAASHIVGVLARFADTEEISFEDDDGQ